MSTELVREVAGVSLATQRHYIIKRKFWSVFERVFRVWTGDGQLIMYIMHPVLRLREELVVYADEAQSRPLYNIAERLNFGENAQADDELLRHSDPSAAPPAREVRVAAPRSEAPRSDDKAWEVPS